MTSRKPPAVHARTPRGHVGVYGLELWVKYISDAAMIYVNRIQPQKSNWVIQVDIWNVALTGREHERLCASITGAENLFPSNVC